MDLIIRPGGDGRLAVLFPYSPERVSKIKTVPGRRWQAAEKHWTVPDEPGMREKIEKMFHDGSAPPASPAPAVDSDPVIERLSKAVKARHLSPRTEEAYVAWTRRYLRHAAAPVTALDEASVGRFLSELATGSHVAASTQNQALSALLFFFEHALGRKLSLIDGVIRAKRPERLPVVLSKEEVRRTLDLMSGAPRLIAVLHLILDR